MVSPILPFDAASTFGPDAASAAPPADCAPTLTFFPPLLPQAPTSTAAAATAINRPTTERPTNAAPPPGPRPPYGFLSRGWYGRDGYRDWSCQPFQKIRSSERERSAALKSVPRVYAMGNNPAW